MPFTQSTPKVAVGFPLRRIRVRGVESERDELEEKLKEKEAALSERQASVPIHSIRPHQFIEIEELEDEIAKLRKLLQSR